MANKDFIVKNSLIVGETATINGVQIDPSGATSGKVLKFDGSKFAPASEGDISGTVYTATIGDGTNSSYTITHGFGTRNVVVVIRNAASPYEVINARWEATTTNTITVDFSSPVTSDSVIVSIYGAVTGVSTGSSYYQTIGNGTDSSFTLAHNFNTRDVVVTARNAASPYEVISARWEAETANTVVLDFSVAPSSNSVRVGVYATVSGTAVTTIDDLGDVTIASVATGDFLKWNGTTWVNANAPTQANLLAISSNIIPSVDNTYSLGNASFRWQSISIGGGTIYITDSGNNNQVALTVNNGVFNIDGIVQAQLPNVAVTNLTFNDNTVQTTAARSIPNGGSTGQVLSKTNGTDYNVQWSNVPAETLDNVSDVVITSAQNGQLLEFDGTNWVNAVRPSSEPIGHENKADSVISFNEGTRTFSIAPASASFTVWCAGKRFVKTTTETVQIPDTSDLYYIYYNSSGVLSYRTTFFVWDTDAPTAYIYWNEVDNKAYFFGDERHGITLDWATHEYLHRTRGAAIANGFGANNYILNGNGSSDTHAKIDIANGTFFDEDLQVDITHSATPTANTWEQVLQGNAEIPVFYRLNNHWTKDVATEFPLKQGTDRPQYNPNTAGTWSTEDVQNNHFGVSWIIATNNLNEPVIAILGQASYTNNGSAQAEFYTALNLDGFPIVEFRPLYKIIYECKTSYTNTPSARITDVIDLRSVVSSEQGVGATPVSDHGSMTGLGDDDHTQYLTDARHDALDHTTAIGSASLDDIGNVSASAAASGDFLKYDGANWVNDPINLGTDTVGNYMSDLTQGTGVTITHTPGEGSNATIGIGQDVATSSSVTFANVTSTGNVAISGRIDKTTIRESVADTSVSAGVVTADYSTGDIFYVGTAPSSNFTVNLTNAPTDDGKAVTVVLFVTQGATGYIPNAVQVAGSAQTIKWANGAAPTPTSSAGKIDIFSFTFVRRSSAWTVFGSSNLGY